MPGAKVKGKSHCNRLSPIMVMKSQTRLKLLKLLTSSSPTWSTAHQFGLWSPHYSKDKAMLERVQHRFTRLFPSRNLELWDMKTDSTSYIYGHWKKGAIEPIWSNYLRWSTVSLMLHSQQFFRSQLTAVQEVMTRSWPNNIVTPTPGCISSLHASSTVGTAWHKQW